MSMFAKVRRLFHRDHLSISEIQRRTSLSRNTIKAWLEEGNPDNYKYPKRPQVTSKLTPYMPTLLLALEVDTRRAKRDRRTGLILFEAIKQEGYTGGYSILTDYIRHWRNGSITVGRSAYVPLKFALGEAFQFDWSEEWLVKCSDGLSNKTDAVKSSYKLPKKVFGLYKSASLHTKQERKLPVQVYILAACLVLIVALGSRFKSRFDEIMEPGSEKTVPALSQNQNHKQNKIAIKQKTYPFLICKIFHKINLA